MSAGATGDAEQTKKWALLELARNFPRITQIGWPWTVSDDEFVGASFHGAPPDGVHDMRVPDLSRRKHDIVCTGSFDQASCSLVFSIPLRALVKHVPGYAAVEFVRLDGFDVRHTRPGYVEIKTGMAALREMDEAARAFMRGVPFHTDLHARHCHSVPLAGPGFGALVPPAPGFVAVPARQAVASALPPDTSKLEHAVFRSPHPHNSALHLLVSLLRDDDSFDMVKEIRGRARDAAVARDCIMPPSIAAVRASGTGTAQSHAARCLALAAFLAAHVPKAYLGDVKASNVTDGTKATANTKELFDEIERAQGGILSADETDQLKRGLETMEKSSIRRQARTGATWLLEATTLLVTPSSELAVRLVPDRNDALGKVLCTQLVAAHSQNMTLLFPARFTVIVRDVTML